MNELLVFTVDAHGGLERWRQVKRVSAGFQPGGILLRQRGPAFTQMPTQVAVDTALQHVTFTPFLAEGQRGVFEPYRTAVESLDGGVLQELQSPRDSFGSMVQGEPWSPTQLAYFAGYALWMYLTMPFSIVTHGVESEEIDPWLEHGVKWRRLKLTFPSSYVTMSNEQTLYIDDKGLIRRHDYSVDIAGGNQVAHYLFNHQNYDGILFPTRRTVHLRNADNTAQNDFAVITADFNNIRLS